MAKSKQQIKKQNRKTEAYQIGKRSLLNCQSKHYIAKKAQATAELIAKK